MNLQTLLPDLLLTGSDSLLVAMAAKSNVVQVTGVQRNLSPTDIEVNLETTDGASPEVLTSSKV